MCGRSGAIVWCLSSLIVGILLWASLAWPMSLNLVWDPPADTTGITGYRIKWGLSSGGETTIVDTGSTATTWLLTGLPDNASVFVIVVSTDGTTESATPTNEICGYAPGVDCPASAPEIPMRFE